MRSDLIDFMREEGADISDGSFFSQIEHTKCIRVEYRSFSQIAQAVGKLVEDIEMRTSHFNYKWISVIQE